MPKAIRPRPRRTSFRVPFDSFTLTCPEVPRNILRDA